MEDKLYRVAVLPDELIGQKSFHIGSLTHPRSGKPSQFAFSDDYTTLYEILEHKPDFSSWFIGKEIASNGKIFYFTVFDPIYIVLERLRVIAQKYAERFTPLDQILEDELQPHTLKLRKTIKHLDVLTDSKGADDYMAYRYNKEKTLKWLAVKVARVEAYLKKTPINVKSGSQSANFVRSDTETNSPLEYQRYAFGLVSDYIQENLSEELREHLGIEKEKVLMPEVMEPPKKKGKTSSGGPLEDYSKDLNTEKKTEKKMTALQKKMSKVDKSGMKSITSFFAPKKK